MKWTYIIVQKIKMAFSLGIVFVLVFATNMMDKNYFSELQNSFASVYEDRLLVESYIYRLSTRLHKKKMLVGELNRSTSANTQVMNQVHNDTIAALISKYEETELTKEESLVFNDFKKDLQELFFLEAKYSDTGFKDTLKVAIEELHRNLARNLDRLSEIQILEGKKHIDNSKRIISASNLTSQVEICILVVIALIVQVLILTSKSMKPKFSQDSSMN